jgi:hypothetical protein
MEGERKEKEKKSSTTNRPNIISMGAFHVPIIF